MTQTQTTTSQVPQRITSTHYQIQGDTHPERTYDLTYENGRWNCNCPDVRHNHNDNCKHRRALIAHITEQIAEQQARSQAAEIIEDMQRAITGTRAKIEVEADELKEQFEAEIDSLKRKHAEEIEDLQKQLDDHEALFDFCEKEAETLQAKINELEARIKTLEAKPKPRTRKPKIEATPIIWTKEDEARKQAEQERRERLPLNGNKPFSLMK